MNIKTNVNNRKIHLYDFNSDKIIIKEVVGDIEHFLASFRNREDALNYMDILNGKAKIVKIDCNGNSPE